MKKTNNKLITLWVDSKKVDELEAKLSNLLPLLQKTVDAFKTLNLPGAENLNLTEILSSDAIIQAHIRSIVPPSLDVAGLIFNKERLLSLKLYELPGYQLFTDSLAEFKVFEGDSYLQYFTLNNQKVAIDAEKVKIFADANSIVARELDEVKLVNLWISFVKATDSFNRFVWEKYKYPVLDRLNDIRIEEWVLRDKEGKIGLNYKTFNRLTRKGGSRVATQVEIS